MFNSSSVEDFSSPFYFIKGIKLPSNEKLIIQIQVRETNIKSTVVGRKKTEGN
jgi:hypothetical protein